MMAGCSICNVCAYLLIKADQGFIFVRGVAALFYSSISRHNKSTNVVWQIVAEIFAVWQ